MDKAIHLLLKETPQPAWVYHPTSLRFLAVNPAAVKLFGYPPQTFLSLTLADLCADGELPNPGDSRLPAGEWRFRTHNGLWLHLIAQTDTLTYQGQPAIICILHDPKSELDSPTRQAKKKREREIETLYHSSAMLNQFHKREEVGQKILEIISANLNWDHATIWLIREPDRLQMIAHACPDPEQNLESDINSVQSILQTTNDGMVGWAIRNGKPRRVDNVDENPYYKITHRDIRSGVYAPLKIGQQAIGCISVESHSLADFDAHDERLLEILASQAAIAFENARLFEQIELRAGQLKALIETTQAVSGNLQLETLLENILKIAQRVIPAAEKGTVLLRREPDHALVIYAAIGYKSKKAIGLAFSENEGYASVSIQKRCAIKIEDVQSITRMRYKGPIDEVSQVQSAISAPLIAKGKVIGAICLDNTYDPRAFNDQDIQMLEAFASSAAIAIDNASLFNDLQNSNEELIRAYDATIEGWAQTLELRDRETEGHSRRVTEMALRLAQKAGIQGEELAHMRRGAILHDIGKIGVPDNILRKAGPLTPAEWDHMRQHPIFAYNLLSQIPYLQQSLEIPYSHHERWQGQGYPLGLKGEKIPLQARIFAIADVYDALISNRPYRAAMSQPDVLAYLKKNAGVEFDPRLVEIFIEMIREEDRE